MKSAFIGNVVHTLKLNNCGPDAVKTSWNIRAVRMSYIPIVAILVALLPLKHGENNPRTFLACPHRLAQQFVYLLFLPDLAVAVTWCLVMAIEVDLRVLHRVKADSGGANNLLCLARGGSCNNCPIPAAIRILCNLQPRIHIASTN